MYICCFCKQTVSPNISANHIVIATRARSYPARREANPVSRDRRKAFTDDPGGSGREIVREALACPDCAKAFAEG
jgi:hypothetical protein